MQLDEPHVQAHYPPDCSRQFSGNELVAIATMTAAGDRKVDQPNLIRVVVRLGRFAKTFAAVFKRFLHARQVNWESGAFHTASWLEAALKRAGSLSHWRMSPTRQAVTWLDTFSGAGISPVRHLRQRVD